MHGGTGPASFKPRSSTAAVNARRSSAEVSAGSGWLVNGFRFWFMRMRPRRTARYDRSPVRSTQSSATRAMRARFWVVTWYSCRLTPTNPTARMM